MKILLLAYYFPPLGGAGVQRALKFAKYLPEFGITPVVISADEPGYTTDDSLLADLPDEIEVHRICHTPLLTRVMNLVRLLRSGRPSRRVDPQTKPVTGGASAYLWRDRLLRGYAMLQFPDDKRGWARRAYAQAAELLSRGDIDMIVSTAPPMSAHFFAARLKRRFGVPWVADYRDLWTGNPFYDAPAWRRWMDLRAERQLLTQADGAIGVTQEMVTLLGRDLTAGREIIFLPNGYDEADFSGIAPTAQNDGRFVLLYTGSMYGHRSPAGILAAARLLLKRQPEFAGRLCLRFIGSIGSRFETLFSAFETEFPGVVERLAYVPHQEVPAALTNADALLLVVGGGSSARGELTGKVFEYLRAGRPVLLLGPRDGEAARMIEETGHGVVMDEGDEEGTAALLSEWLSGNLPSDILPHDPCVIRFERRALTGRLAEFLRHVHEKSVPER